MDKLIFRNDDINPNTNFYRLGKMYLAILSVFPEAEIWSCVTLFGKTNKDGSVYPGVPFKDNPLKWFYDVDDVMPYYDEIFGKLVSHGLLHADHSELTKDAQEMSIVTSCKFLKTNTFVPPFNRYNLATVDVCKDNNIKLVTNQGWKNFEYEKFDVTQKKWYFHSWRWTPDSLKKLLDENSRNVV